MWVGMKMKSVASTTAPEQSGSSISESADLKGFTQKHPLSGKALLTRDVYEYGAERK